MAETLGWKNKMKTEKLNVKKEVKGRVHSIDGQK